MSVATLSGFVGALLDARVADVAPTLLRRTSAVVLDTASVGWAASRDPQFQALAPLAHGSGRSSTVIRGANRVDAESAAFLNGTAAVWCEMDEGFRGAGHPGAHVVSAGVALAEDRGRSGTELLLAILQGYELQAALGLNTTLRPEVHAHGALGAPAAALTASSLLGLDAERATQAVNIAANLAPAGLWLSCLGGQTVRNTLAGSGAQVGIRAALLASAGVTAREDSCEVGYGIVRGTAFSGWPRFEREWSLRAGYLKQWSACAYSHTALDAAEAITRDPEFRAADVSAVSVFVPAVGALLSSVLFGPPLAVRFSLPVLVALVLCGVDVKRPESAGDVPLEVRRLAERVHIVEDAELTAWWPEHSRARVVVSTVNGAEHAKERWDPVTPTEDESFVDAVVSKAGRLHDWLDPSGAYERIEDLVRATYVSDIFSLPTPMLHDWDVPQQNVGIADAEKRS